MELNETNIFTGIPEVDTEILDKLDDKTLYNTCMVNSYSSELCMNDKFLRKRINDYLENKKKRWFMQNIGIPHRDNDMPAIIQINAGENWYQHGRLHRDNDMPALRYY